MRCLSRITPSLDGKKTSYQFACVSAGRSVYLSVCLSVGLCVWLRTPQRVHHVVDWSNRVEFSHQHNNPNHLFGNARPYDRIMPTGSISKMKVEILRNRPKRRRDCGKLRKTEAPRDADRRECATSGASRRSHSRKTADHIGTKLRGKVYSWQEPVMADKSSGQSNLYFEYTHTN